MPWTRGSRVFREWLAASLEPRDDFNGAWNGDNVFRCALYNDTGTPNEQVAANLTAYNTGQWVLANEEIDRATPPPASRPHWPRGGLPILDTGAGGGYDSSTFLVTFDGEDTGTQQAGLPADTELVTLDDVYGDLVYDTTAPANVGAGTPANPGACFHSYSGRQQVTSGTFTVVWAVEGIMRVGVADPANP